MITAYNILDFGAIPDTTHNSAKAIQSAIDKAAQLGGGTIVIPAGKTFMTGSIVLRSKIRLNIEPGAVLLASPNINDYVNYEHIDLFAKSDFCRFWILALEAQQITIDGQGTLDGNSSAYIIEKLESHSKARSPRAQSIVFLGCQDIVIRDIRIINTPSWAIRPAGCDRVLIENITILNDLGLVNSDGIDIDCSRSVRITNCHIESGDDAISIKGRREIAAKYGSCEDIVITNCILESHCCAFRLGCESYVDFRRIVFSQSTIRRSHRGIAIDCRDESIVEDILISDIAIETIHSHRVWWHEGEAIWIVQVPYVPGHLGGDNRVAKLRNIVFRNIAINSEQGVYVQGADNEHHPSDILFENVHVHLKKTTKYPAGFFDPRPNRPCFLVAGNTGIEENTPWGTLFRHNLPAFFFDRAENIILRNCKVTWSGNMPSVYTYALESHAASGLILENFNGAAAQPELESIYWSGNEPVIR